MFGYRFPTPYKMFCHVPIFPYDTRRDIATQLISLAKFLGPDQSRIQCIFFFIKKQCT